jgi:hypothetical protein
MSKYTIPALGLLIFAAACGSTTVSPTGSTTSGAGGASSGAGGGAGAGTTTGAGGALEGPSYSVSFGPVKVAPGEEHTQCIVARLGNPEAFHVGSMHNLLTQGSHHLIVYRTADTEEKLTPYDCQPFADTLNPAKGSPLMVTQKHDEVLTFPEGVAVTLDANQMIRLEMHYINPSDAEIEVKATSTFVTLPDEKFKDEAGFLFLGDPDINIEPHSKQTLGPVFLKLPSKVDGVNFFGITGHTHQFGTNVTVAVSANKDDPGKSVYDVPNWSWSEPPTVYQDPPFQVPAGGGFRFSCSWNNTSDQSVKFGESANDEMCFFWAYYYPSKGAFVCAHTDQVPGGFDLCCPGPALCDKIFN